MPELPEVETIVRKLTRGEPAEAGLPTYPSLIGTEITHAWGNWQNSIRPSIRAVTRALPGHRIESLGRRGKYIVLTLQSGCRRLRSLSRHPPQNERADRGP